MLESEACRQREDDREAFLYCEDFVLFCVILCNFVAISRDFSRFRVISCDFVRSFYVLCDFVLYILIL